MYKKKSEPLKQSKIPLSQNFTYIRAQALKEYSRLPQNLTGYRQRDPKLSFITLDQANLQQEKYIKLDHFDAKVNQISTNYQDFNDIESRKFQKLKEQMLGLQQYVEQQRQQTDAIYQVRMSNLKEFEQKVFERFSFQAQAYRDLERRFLNSLDEKVCLLRNEITTESKTRYEAIEHLKKCLENDIPTIQQQIKVQSVSREQNDAQILHQSNEELKTLNDVVQKQKHSRQQTEQSLLQTLKDMINRIKNQISAEKKQREATQDNLLKLIEETCSKLNHATQF